VPFSFRSPEVQHANAGTSIDLLHYMPWYNGTYPPSYKNQPEKLRNKAVEFVNALILKGAPEGVAIASGLKKAREHFTPVAKRNHKKK
jgi:uncharacterized protein YdaT